jgi:hypothetical protein
MGSVRPWLVGVVCVTCAVVSRITFVLYAEPSTREDAQGELLFVGQWFGLGMLFLATPLLRQQHAPGAPAWLRPLGLALWVAAALIGYRLIVRA